MTGALTGTRVIDFGQYIAGPLAAMLLSDQGAEVIRVDPSGGPRFETAANAVWNRGKRSIVLDLSSPADRETARRLAVTADVVIENFRPGVMARFGLDAEALTASAPGLIYCSLPGFASDDPRAGLAAWDGVVLAAASAFGFTPDGEPVYSALPIPSAYAAFLGVNGIVMALHARDRDGVGQRVEVPLFDATFTALGFRAQKVHQQPAGGRGDLPPEILAAMGQARFGRVSLAGTHLCADDRWVYVHSGNKNILDFVRATGADAFDGDPDVPARVRDMFRTRTAREWEDLGASVGTEVVAFRTSAEWIDEAQPREGGMVIELDDWTLGRMVQPGLQVHMSATPGAIRGAAPQLDADREAILAELVAESTTNDVAPSVPAGMTAAPLDVLDGVKVLDLCIVLAGPTCGRTLAEYGADVIKVDSPPRRGPAAPGGAPARANSFNIDINRGKRSIVIDLKTPEGLEVFWRLVEGADVVLENFRDGIADKLGIGYDAVRQRRPDIVYASLNMYGYAGPWAGRPGHEQLGQAATGMAMRFGGDEMPLLQHVGAVNDYGTGLMGAYAVGLALLHRGRTGEGQRVWSSLAHTAAILQSPYLFDHSGKTWNEPSGQGARGDGPLQHVYPTADGWIFLGAAPSRQSALGRVEGLAGVAGLDGDELVGFLTKALPAETAATWVDRLAAVDMGAHRITRLAEVMEDRWVRDHGLIVSWDTPATGLVDQVGTTTRLSRTPPSPRWPAPQTGADGRAILIEHGLADDIDRLVAAGAVHLRD